MTRGATCSSTRPAQSQNEPSPMIFPNTKQEQSCNHQSFSTAYTLHFIYMYDERPVRRRGSSRS